MPDSPLKVALRNYPLEGWDTAINIADVPREEMRRIVGELLEEHEQFPVPWDTSQSHVGTLVVKHGDRYLGHSGIAGPASDDPDISPAIGLMVEDLVDNESAAEAIVQVHFERGYGWPLADRTPS